MSKKTPDIAAFEELVLLAILQLGKKAYGASIYEKLEQAGRRTAIGALYTTLSRLEEKGLIRSKMGEPTPERGGRAKKFYTVDGSAVRALNDRERARRFLRSEPAFSTGGSS